MPHARVDVVVPAFNAAATLGDAIGSLRAQTFGDFRIIIVNDGSTDDTPAIAEGLRAADERIHVIHQTNGGIVEARNVGLRAATADYLAVQDADDLSDPDRLRTQVDYLDETPTCVAVSGSARHVDASGSPTGGVSTMPPLAGVDATWTPAREPYLMPFGLIRRRAMAAIGGYRHVDFAEDTDLYWRLRRRGGLTNLPDVVGSYRYHSGSATGGGSLVDTRILAVNNQLAALSSTRLDAGKDDLVFDRSGLGRYRRAATLADMVAVASAGLQPSETSWFTLAVAAKMLQWLEGRHLQPDLDDCRFIRRAYDARLPADADNKREVRRLYTVIGARLLRQGRVAKAHALLPLTFVPEACARSMLGRC